MGRAKGTGTGGRKAGGSLRPLSQGTSGLEAPGQPQTLDRKLQPEEASQQQAPRDGAVWAWKREGERFSTPPYPSPFSRP